jgi:hypothetical protein
MLTCKECGELMESSGMVFVTLVGMASPPGHTHDDNCQTLDYHCPNGHFLVVSKRRKCLTPGCSWVGKDTCFCHHGPKVDKWP